MKNTLRKISFIALLALFVLAPMSYADNHAQSASLYGSNGGFRLHSAKVPYHGRVGFQFGFYSQYFTDDDMFAAGNDTERLVGQFSYNIIPARFLEIFGTWSASSNRENANASLIQQVGNETIGVKLSHSFTPFASLGLAFQAEYLENIGDLNLTDTAWNYVPWLVTTFDFREHKEKKVPLLIHLNAGYRWDNSLDLTGGTALTAEQRFLTRVFPQDQLLLGLGFEIPIHFINFIAEYSTEQMIESGGGEFTENPQRATVGVKVSPTRQQNFSVNLAADIKTVGTSASNMVFAEPTYNILFGLTYSTVNKPLDNSKPKTGDISGIVLDNKTGQPIGGAIISFPELELTRLQSHPVKGTFATAGIAPGVLNAQVEHEGYESITTTIDVTAGTTKDVEIRLSPMLTKGTAIIKITNTSDQAVDGKIEFLDHPKMQTIVVAKKGLGIKLPPDTYNIKVTADGYEPEEHRIEVKSNDRQMHKFSLRASGIATLADNKISISSKIYFALGKAQIQQRSLPILDNIADLINDHPEAKRIRVEGHTDSTGSRNGNLAISKKRAAAVVNYLASKGVAADRLEATGYGPDEPIADNGTKEGRAANRRVEFSIIEWNKPVIPE